jgi:hypothetical protein
MRVEEHDRVFSRVCRIKEVTLQGRSGTGGGSWRRDDAPEKHATEALVCGVAIFSTLMHNLRPQGVREFGYAA